MKSPAPLPTGSSPAVRAVVLCSILAGFPALAQTATAPAPGAGSAEPPGDTVQMSVFEVSIDRDIGYRAMSSVAGSRTGQDLRNVPMPISVPTEEFLGDVDATDIMEAARFSTGGRGMPTDDNDQQAFQFRGFRSQYQTRNLFVWQAPTDAYNVERIDIAKGPNALLFGTSEPGGVANFNTKRAQLTDRTAIGFRVGSWDQYRATLDVNRRITANLAGTEKLERQGHFASARFRGYKADIWEGGHRVPFLVRWPGRVAPGSRIDTTICLTDIMATLAEISGARVPPTAAEDSFSFLPDLLCTGRSARTSTVHHSIDGRFALREGPWKLELCPGGGGWAKPRDAEAKAAGLPGVQLYNLAEDAAEKKNLHAAEPQRVQRLTAKLRQIVDAGRSTPGPAQKNDVSIDLFGEQPNRKR